MSLDLRKTMDDAYAIRLAKTEFRDAYNKGDVSRVSAVFADAYSDMSSGLASFYGTEAQAVLKYRSKKLFARYRYLEIWQKDANGRWKTTIFLDNVDVPPEMPPK